MCLGTALMDHPCAGTPGTSRWFSPSITTLERSVGIARALRTQDRLLRATSDLCYRPLLVFGARPLLVDSITLVTKQILFDPCLKCPTVAETVGPRTWNSGIRSFRPSFTSVRASSWCGAR